MLTRRGPFGGESVTDVLASVVKDQPDFDALPAETPWRVRELLAKCLVKDRHERLHDIGDARLELEAARARPEPSRGDGAEARATGRRTAAWLGLSALGGALAASVAWWMATSISGAGKAPHLARLSIQAEPGFQVEDLALSPDGQTLVYRGVPRPGAPDRGVQLLVRPLSGSHAWAVEGSEGVTAFTFSPDGERVTFKAPVAPQSSRERILKVSSRGGTPPFAVVDWDPQWAEGSLAWLSDGDLLDYSPHASTLMGSEVLPDGRVLATCRGDDEGLPDSISVVFGFSTEVERLVTGTK